MGEKFLKILGIEFLFQIGYLHLFFVVNTFNFPPSPQYSGDRAMFGQKLLARIDQ